MFFSALYVHSEASGLFSFMEFPIISLSLAASKSISYSATSPHILLRIEPQDVQVVQAQEAVRKEAFLFFFLRRERRTYSVELDVTVNVTAINLDQVDFVTQR